MNLEHLKRAAVSSGGIPFTEMFEGVALPDGALLRFARAIAEECAAVCEEPTGQFNAHSVRQECASRILNLFKEE